MVFNFKTPHLLRSKSTANPRNSQPNRTPAVRRRNGHQQVLRNQRWNWHYFPFSSSTKDTGLANSAPASLSMDHDRDDDHNRDRSSLMAIFPFYQRLSMYMMDVKERASAQATYPILLFFIVDDAYLIFLFLPRGGLGLILCTSTHQPFFCIFDLALAKEACCSESTSQMWR
jgi:hypothetical protein